MKLNEFKEFDEETIKKIKELKEVTREKDGDEAFYDARFYIADELYRNDKYNDAIDILSTIPLLSNGIKYAVVQTMIGDLYTELGNVESALIAYNNIRITHDIECYFKAQLEMGRLLMRGYEKDKLIKAKIHFKNIDDSHPYEFYCFTKIIDIILSESGESFGWKIENLLNNVFKILEELTLTFSTEEDLPNKSPERKLAHYTSAYVANIVLSGNEWSDKESLFRLNTINNVNDPSEGQLLSMYLNDETEEVFYSPEFDKNLQAFVGCFTFNHNSLNQFRLYGKEDNMEASGLSLVFNQEFFKAKSHFDGVSISPELKDRLNKGSGILKQNVLRCIYTEPISEYIHLAQRNRITFYREFGKDGEPENQWEDYESDILDKTIKVQNALNDLKIIYREIMTDYFSQFKEHTDLIDKILLPLKYLIKHSAFQEEQECRMIYLTSIDSSEVKMDFGNALYVEYEPDVKSHLDKIYIAPAATQYQPYLAKLLSGTKVKIELSKTPYRQT